MSFGPLTDGLLPSSLLHGPGSASSRMLGASPSYERALVNQIASDSAVERML